jgi:hypothetical protein
MKTRNEILSKFAALVEQDAKELDPEFKKRLEPGFGKRKEDEFQGTPEYIPGISGRKDNEPDVSKGYGISKRNAKILAEEDPESYVHKHKYHLVGKLNEITSNMLMNIIENTPEKYFEYKFHYVPEFGKIDEAAWRSLVRKNPLEAVRKQIFDKPEFVNLLVPLFKLAMKQLGWSTNDLKYFSTKLRALSDEELRTGLHELVFLIRAKQSDSFFQDSDLNMLKNDSYFKKLFVKEEGTEKLSMTKLDLESITKLGELLKEAVDIPVPPVPTNISVAPASPSKAPSGPSAIMPIELPEPELEPTEEEERAFQERQRRNELEEQTYIVEQLPDEVAEALAVLPGAEVGSDRAEGKWQDNAYPYWNYLWSFQVDESRVRSAPTYSADIAKYPASFVGKTSGKPQILFEQTSPNAVELFKALRSVIFEQLQKQQGTPGASKKYEEWVSEKNVSEEDLKKEVMKEKLEEREKSLSLSFLKAKDLITKVSIRLKTKGFVDEANKLKEVIQNLKY